MRHQLVIGFLAGVGFAALLGLAALASPQATAQQCKPGPHCIGLPGVKKEFVADTATPTIAVTPVISSNFGCNSAQVPEPAEGLQAWVVNTFYPRVCTRLFVNSRYVEGLLFKVQVHAVDGDLVFYPREAAASGYVRFYESVVEVWPAQVERTAEVIVEHDGKTYRTTVLLPVQVLPTATPEPTP
ncbi:MAG: hypothetical protein OHK0022_28130 [Roseiflexaceae bacterium]